MVAGRAAGRVTMALDSVEQDADEDEENFDEAVVQDLGVDESLYRRMKRVKKDLDADEHFDEAANKAVSRFSDRGINTSSIESNISLVAYLATEPDVKYSLLWFQWKAAVLSETSTSRFFFMALVMLNSVLIGLEADYAKDKAASHAFEMAEYVLVALFTLELMAKIFGFGVKTFFSDGWNITDFVIVTASVVEIIIAAIFDVETPSLSALRMVRIIRVIRLIGMLERLAILANAFMHAVHQTFYVMVLAIIIVYVFGVFGQQLFADNAELAAWELSCNTTKYYSCYQSEWYATVPGTMLSLFQIMTWDDWGKITRPVGEPLPSSWGYWATFCILGSLGLMNLITAIFIEALLEQTQRQGSHSREKKRRKAMRKLQVCEQAILDFDLNHDGRLSPDELDNIIGLLEKYPLVADAFAEVGTPLQDLKAMICFAEHREDGSIDIIELLNMVHSANLPTLRRVMFELKHRVQMQEAKEDAGIAQVGEMVQQLAAQLGSLDKTLDSL